MLSKFWSRFLDIAKLIIGSCNKIELGWRWTIFKKLIIGVTVILYSRVIRYFKAVERFFVRTNLKF